MPGTVCYLFCCGIAVGQLREQRTTFESHLLNLHMVSCLNPSALATAFRWAPRKRGLRKGPSLALKNHLLFCFYIVKASCWILGNKMIE